jgi:hypothetical protein
MPVRRHPRQAACRSGWAEEGRRHRGAQCLGPAALVEAAGVAASRPAPLAADRHGGLSRGGSGFSSNRIRPIDVARCYRPAGRLPLEADWK